LLDYNFDSTVRLHLDILLSYHPDIGGGAWSRIHELYSCAKCEESNGRYKILESQVHIDWWSRCEIHILEDHSPVKDVLEIVFVMCFRFWIHVFFLWVIYFKTWIHMLFLDVLDSCADHVLHDLVQWIMWWI
jgi:hypothetical protein